MINKIFTLSEISKAVNNTVRLSFIKTISATSRLISDALPIATPNQINSFECMNIIRSE
jgi:hypothetical protein